MTEHDPRSRLERGGRGVVAAVFGIIAVAGVLASVLSVWAHRTMFDSSAARRSVERALADPDVVDALAGNLTIQLLDAISASERVESRLPEPLLPAAPFLDAALHALVREGISRALTEDSVQQVLATSAEQAHKKVMRVLDGGSMVDGVTINDSTVSLNLLPLMGRALGLVEGTGLLRNIDISDLDASGDPATQIRDLEAVLGRPLPPDFGQLVIWNSETVESATILVARAQQAVVLFRRSVVAILAITLISIPAAIALSVRRRRAVFLLTLGIVGSMATGRAIIQQVIEAAPGLAVQPGARAAIRTVVTTMAEGLLTATAIAVATSLALSILAFTTGPGGPARTIRASLRRNREMVSLIAFVAVAATLTVDGFSLGSLLLVLLAGAGLVAVAWLPGADDESTESASPGGPELRA